MKPAIEVKQVSHAFGDQVVLDQISFAVPQGAFFIIIGPNGSGKTTLMKLMTANIRLRKGEVAIQGQPLRSYSRRALARITAWLPQMLNLNFPMTVKDLVLMGRSPHLGILGFEKARDHAIAANAMDYTDIARLQDRYIDQLSGGEQQRVLIARAICQDPEIIFLDEPTAALDIAHQMRIMDLMEKLKTEKQITIVMISHDINVAAMYADKVMLLKAGRQMGLGAPHEVFTYEALENAYGCPLLVDESPLGEYLRITPVPKRYLNIY